MCNASCVLRSRMVRAAKGVRDIAFSELSVEELRVCLRKMNDGHLVEFGKAARLMCSPKANFRTASTRGVCDSAQGSTRRIAQTAPEEFRRGRKCHDLKTEGRFPRAPFRSKYRLGKLPAHTRCVERREHDVCASAKDEVWTGFFASSLLHSSVCGFQSFNCLKPPRVIPKARENIVQGCLHSFPLTDQLGPIACR